MDQQIIVASKIPTITVYVRHAATCPHGQSGPNENFRKCKCMKHIRYFHNGKLERTSAKTRVWSIADQLAREMTERFAKAEPATTITLVTPSRTDLIRALSLFISDKRTQGISQGVLNKYQRELDRLRVFMAKRSKHFPNEILLEDLTEFRSEWNDLYPSTTTRQKVQERLRGFLRYCHDAKLIDRVPRLSPIKVIEPPTLPLTDAEYKKLCDATSKFKPVKAQRLHCIVQLMRWSGLAIQDAVTLKRSGLEYDPVKKWYRIVTSRQKTGTHVSVPIPTRIAEEILTTMKLNENPEYIFWNREGGKPNAAVGVWGKAFTKAFRAAGLPDGHPHQLRDTFAVDLLSKGVPIEEVSKALGHESIKTTEKSYAKWVVARQDRLDNVVRATWESEAA